MPIAKDREMLKESYSHVLIGTPGRACGTKDLKLDELSQFVLDDCDECLDKLDMRKDETPKKKQVMLFSAMMTSETRVLCKKFISDPHEIRVDEESKLTLDGLRSYACSGIQPVCGLREVCAESDRCRRVARQGFVRVDFHASASDCGHEFEEKGSSGLA